MKKKSATREDLALFVKRFKRFFKLAFENKVSLYQQIGRNIVGWGYDCIYVEQVGVIDGRLGLDRIKGDLDAMIWLDVGVNPNGITGKDDIGIAYTIHYELKANVRQYRCKYFDRVAVLKFYSYGRTPEELIEKFKEYLHGKRRLS